MLLLVIDERGKRASRLCAETLRALVEEQWYRCNAALAFVSDGEQFIEWKRHVPACFVYDKMPDRDLLQRVARRNTSIAQQGAVGEQRTLFIVDHRDACDLWHVDSETRPVFDASDVLCFDWAIVVPAADLAAATPPAVLERATDIVVCVLADARQSHRVHDAFGASTGLATFHAYVNALDKARCARAALWMQRGEGTHAQISHVTAATHAVRLGRREQWQMSKHLGATATTRTLYTKYMQVFWHARIRWPWFNGAANATPLWLLSRTARLPPAVLRRVCLILST